jgi:excisionase family DNA binding protein
MLHWQGGDHTHLEVVKNRTGQHRWKTDTATEELIRELARLLPDQSIASVLNRLGMRSAKGHTWTQERVRNFRCEHRIAIYREGERAERHELILHEAASRLEVSKMTVIRLIRDGLLPARQICVGAPYVIQQDDLDRPAVRRALQNGRAVSLDVRQELDRPHLKGLPSEPYVFAEWRLRRVGIDYHVEVEAHFYSVPYRFGRREVRGPADAAHRRGLSQRRARRRASCAPAAITATPPSPITCHRATGAMPTGPSSAFARRPP